MRQFINSNYNIMLIIILVQSFYRPTKLSNMTSHMNNLHLLEDLCN